jgi:flagellar basal-body rod protein FlgG
MNVSLYQAAAAMSANARWQEVISENLSSAAIPGFKKQDLSFTAVQAGLMPRGETAGTRQPYALPGAGSFTNFSPGEIKQTGLSTNLALEGPGFFEVQLPGGARAYTRDGEFQLNAQGQLVTKQGYPVLGDGGPVQFDPAAGLHAITISPTGEISQGGEPRGKLKVADFANPAALTPVGGGYFEAREAGAVPANTAKATIRQGYIEGANTSATTEMVNLIAAMRSFEANQRVVQIQDERLGRMISELGNPNA